MNSWLIGKESDAGRDWGQEEKGTTEDEMAGWHHWLDGCESECSGVGDGQGGLVCCDSWGRKESDTTERLNWTELNTWTAGRAGRAGLSPSIACPDVLRHFLWKLEHQNNGKKGFTVYNYTCYGLNFHKDILLLYLCWSSTSHLHVDTMVLMFINSTKIQAIKCK